MNVQHVTSTCRKQPQFNCIRFVVFCAYCFGSFSKECYGCASLCWGSVLGCWASRFLWLEVAVLRVFCSAVLCSPPRQASSSLFSATFQQLCYCAWLVRVFDLWTRAVFCRTHGAANVGDFPGNDGDTRRAFVCLSRFHSERTFLRCFPTGLPNGGCEHRKRLRVFV